MFSKVPQSSLEILRVPQLPPPLEHPPRLRTLQLNCTILKIPGKQCFDLLMNVARKKKQKYAPNGGEKW